MTRDLYLDYFHHYIIKDSMKQILDTILSFKRNKYNKALKNIAFFFV